MKSRISYVGLDVHKHSIVIAVAGVPIHVVQVIAGWKPANTSCAPGKRKRMKKP